MKKKKQISRKAKNTMIDKMATIISTLILVFTLSITINFTYGEIVKPKIEQNIEHIKEYGNLSLREQLDGLFEEVSNNLNIDTKYIKIMHSMAGNTAIFENTNANIYLDKTNNDYKAPFYIKGANQKYNKKYINDKTNNEENANEFYFPDATYNVARTINDLMITRRNVKREKKEEFEKITQTVQKDIIFYEALLKYLKVSDKEINKFYDAYIEVLLNVTNKTLVTIQEDGTYKINENARKIFIKYGLENIDKIAIALSFDKNINKYTNINELLVDYILAYEYGKTSKLNALQCALSMIGEVRYVWGGGHLGTANIQGINPLWFKVNDIYEDEGKINTCIEPDDYYCIVHGSGANTENACLLEDTGIKTLEDYFEVREEYIDFTDKEKETILNSKVFDTLNLENKVPAHRLEGLDCSGLVSWIYNQIDTTRTYDGNAYNFVETNGFTPLEFGTRLEPCDLIAWQTHITLVVSDYSKNTYIIVEASPNTIKAGIAYYKYNKKELNKAKKIAKQINDIFGSNDSKINMHDLSKKENLTLGRFNNKEWLDEEYINELKTTDLINIIKSKIPKMYLD